MISPVQTMPAPHDYIYTFSPDSDEPEIGERPGVDLRKAPNDPAVPPPEVPPVATRPPATPPPAPPPSYQQPPPPSGQPHTGDEAWVEEWDDDDWEDEDDWDEDDAHDNAYEDVPQGRSALSLVFNIVLVVMVSVFFFAAILGFKDTAHTRLAAPMGELTAAYTKKTHLYGKWPFFMSYYLMLPEGYDARYPYPLVMELPGRDYKSHAGRILARPEYRHAFKAIVVVPFISDRTLWKTPPEPDLKLAPGAGPLDIDPLADAVGLIFKLAEQFTVDPRRVYVVGHNTGGMGAYAAAANYNHVFAAAVSSGGAWTPTQADQVNIPVLAYHGAADPLIPAELDREFVNAAKAAGANIHYVELPNRQDDIAGEIFTNAQTWQWLFSQTKLQ